MAKGAPKGRPKPPGSGRQPGSPNKATLEAREFCRDLLEQERVRARYQRQLISGKLSPVIEALIWHYAYGLPKASMDLTIDQAKPFEVEITWAPLPHSSAE